MRYANGAHQAGLASLQAVGGSATWSWDVPIRTVVGRAQVVAHCTGAGTKKHILLIVGAQAPLRVDVVKQGYSIRPRSYGGTDVGLRGDPQNRST